ncbi:hypothetical protein F4824DRAFT_133571 [Ustulina deusta]|nr:hypothetical protein F4824DRAFT_133571 [Ustulina deusta]
MPSPPSSPQSSHSSNSPQPVSDNPPSGLFRNGDWLCDCEPRLRATVRYIKKSTSKNKGKRFYGCPTGTGEGNRCNMFVLVEEAQRRERECLLSNGRSEKKRQTTLPESYTPRKLKQGAGKRLPVNEIIDPEAVGDGPSTSNSTPPPPPGGPNKPPETAETSNLKDSNQDPGSEPETVYDTTSEEDEDEREIYRRTPSRATNNTFQSSARARTPTTQATGSKMKRPFSDEDLLEDLSASGAEEMVAAMERSSRAAIRLGKKRELITPNMVRTTDMGNGIPTPSRTVGKTAKKLFPEGSERSHSGSPHRKRQRLNETEGGRLFGTDAIIAPTTSSPPSPSPAPATAPGTDPAQLTSEVMGLLKDENITFATRHAVRKTLEKYVNLAKGYERGRDASRKAVKEAEARSARLQEKVNDLELGRQETKTIIMDLWHQI